MQRLGAPSSNISDSDISTHRFYIETKDHELPLIIDFKELTELANEHINKKRKRMDESEDENDEDKILESLVDDEEDETTESIDTPKKKKRKIQPEPIKVFIKTKADQNFNDQPRTTTSIRLQDVIHRIESRERQLRFELLQKQKKRAKGKKYDDEEEEEPEEPKKRGPRVQEDVYDSDDSFIDDAEYVRDNLRF